MTSRGRPLISQLTRNQIARATFAAAEKMGISDRKHIERLTQQVIERLERKQDEQEKSPVKPLPGMEELISRTARRDRHTTSESEILDMVKEFLDSEDRGKKRRRKRRLR